MTNLLWPGDHRAGDLLTDAAYWAAMLKVEDGWLQAMRLNGLLPGDITGWDLTGLVDDSDRQRVADEADDGANPVIALVALLRRRSSEPLRPWIHRGLTSQDVVDSAMMLVLKDALIQLRIDMGRQLQVLSGVVAAHRHTPMLARTLTQPAIPITFGVKAATWLNGLADAAETLTGLSTPVQIGGAAGTLAAPTEIAALLQGPARAGQTAMALAADTADALGLDRHMPWHTNRAPVTRIADALVGCTDAWGRVASDIVILTRPEIGELAEPASPRRGGSSTMPDKSNPVLSILLRRAALTAPPLAMALHTAAALTNDERADGAWHAEWDTLRILGRRTLVAGSHATELLGGLQIDAGRMSSNLAAADVSGEQDSIAALLQKAATPDYLGASEQIIDHAIDRAAQLIKHLP